jgi:hypothetical protein
MRRGKKIKVKSFSNRRYAAATDCLHNYFKAEDDRKEFPVLLKKLVLA